MKNLREMLLNEQNRLEIILQQARSRLQNVPPGKLSLSESRKKVQYYHCMPGARKKRTYISKTRLDFIRRLAQKSYDEKVEKLASKRLMQIRRLTKDYEDDEIEKIYLKEHEEKKKLITPIEPTRKQLLEKWIAEEYVQKEFREGTPVILTEKGERVRSKSEKILADYFYRNGIPYKYEKTLYLKGMGYVYPDFTFLSEKTGREIYWEHDGRMDDPVYAQNAVRKILAYEENKIYPGERLILTFETSNLILDTDLVKKLAVRYLL